MRWSEPAISGSLCRACAKAGRRLRRRGCPDHRTADEIQQLNRRFRGKNKPTDVLSFPREDGGDIAICADIAQSNARPFRPLLLASEIKVLILHGMLHLAGYDHETDNGRMEKKEARLRAQLKLPASLIQRTLNLATRLPAQTKSQPTRTEEATGLAAFLQDADDCIAGHEPKR